MSDTTLTATEEKVYQYLIEFLAANSYQPSIREIGREFEIKSTKTVSDVLGSLARKGYIQRNQSRSRGLRIIGAQQSASGRAVPFYESVAAAGPALVAELRTDWVHLDRRLAPSESAFLVRIVENVLPECGVRPQDTVLVDPDSTVLAGDFVVARAGNKTFVRAGTPREGEEILGKICGVFRGAFDLTSDVDAAA
jgi:repressor LexA